jgi:hypothetical protein
MDPTFLFIFFTITEPTKIGLKFRKQNKIVLNMNWTVVGDTRKGWVYIFDQCGQTFDWMPNLKFKSKTDFTLNF